MKSITKLSIWVMAAVALCAAAGIGTANAHDAPSCTSKLVYCVAFLNSTAKPSPFCCIPLKKVIEEEFQCLCDLYNTAEFSGGNVTQALTLPARCGITTDLSVCGIAQPPGPSTSPSPTGTPETSPTSNPGTPPPPGTGSSPSGAEKIIASSSSAGFLIMIFLWISMFLN